MTASTGEAAILEAVSHNPDIVLLDMGLPDIDGVDIIKKKSAHGRLCLLLSSAPEARIRIK